MHHRPSPSSSSKSEGSLKNLSNSPHRHQSTNQNNTRRDFICGCGKAYRNNDDLGSHRRNKHGGIAQPGTKIPDSARRMNRMNKNLPESVIVKRSKSIIPAKRKNTQDDDERPFKCGCGRTYKSTNALNNHIRIDHKGRNPSLTNWLLRKKQKIDSGRLKNNEIGEQSNKIVGIRLDATEEAVSRSRSEHKNWSSLSESSEDIKELDKVFQFNRGIRDEDQDSYYKCGCGQMFKDSKAFWTHKRKKHNGIVQPRTFFPLPKKKNKKSSPENSKNVSDKRKERHEFNEEIRKDDADGVYKCGCGKGYQSYEELRIHRIDKHGVTSKAGKILLGLENRSNKKKDFNRGFKEEEEKSDDEGRNYKCGCGKTYKNMDGLGQHNRIKHKGIVQSGTTIPKNIQSKESREKSSNSNINSNHTSEIVIKKLDITEEISFLKKINRFSDQGIDPIEELHKLCPETHPLVVALEEYIKNSRNTNEFEPNDKICENIVTQFLVNLGKVCDSKYYRKILSMFILLYKYLDEEVVMEYWKEKDCYELPQEFNGFMRTVEVQDMDDDEGEVPGIVNYFVEWLYLNGHTNVSIVDI